MPSFIVRQPDDKLAAFCTVVDSFTATGMTREEAIEYLCMRHHDGAVYAAEKVDAGINDEQYIGGGLNMDLPAGERRWNDRLCVIIAIHGWREALKFMLPDLHWTTVDPTADGWYWCRASSEHAPHIKGVLAGRIDWGGEPVSVASLGLEWYGPLPVPTGEVEETGNG